MVDVADLVYDVGSVVVVSWLVLLLLLPWASLLRRRWRALANHRRRHASLRPLSRPAALQFKFSWQVGFRLSLSLCLRNADAPRALPPAYAYPCYEYVAACHRRWIAKLLRAL